MHDRLAAQDRAHLARLQAQEQEAARRERELQDEQARKDRLYKADLDRLSKLMEELRIEKDTEIKRITDLMEEQRSHYETKINELELTLNRYQQTTVKLESTVLELNQRLSQKEDVEEQLAQWKAHHDSMEASKEEL